MHNSKTHSWAGFRVVVLSGTWDQGATCYAPVDSFYLRQQNQALWIVITFIKKEPPNKLKLIQVYLYLGISTEMMKNCDEGLGIRIFFSYLGLVMISVNFQLDKI